MFIFSRYKVRFDVRKLGREPTIAQLVALDKRRTKLLSQINHFIQEAYTHLGEDICDFITSDQANVNQEDMSDDEGKPSAPVPQTQSTQTPETLIMPFASGLRRAAFARLDAERQEVLRRLEEMELELRKGQIEDSLAKVRDAVIHLSWHMKNVVRYASGVVNTTRSWAGVHILNRVWKIHRNVYLHNRKTMTLLTPEAEREAFLRQYQDLRRQDCSISTQVTDPNSAGQSSRKMPWFWSTRRLSQKPQNPANTTANKGKRKAPDTSSGSDSDVDEEELHSDSDSEEPDSYAVECK